MITLSVFTATTYVNALVKWQQEKDYWNLYFKMQLEKEAAKHRFYSFGSAGHTISFNVEEISEEKVDLLGKEMTTWSYFNHQEKTIYLEVSEDTYTLKIIDDNAVSLDTSEKEQ